MNEHRASKAGVRQLLRTYAQTIESLRDTGVVRSKNNPLADYAEWLVSQALELKLCTKSTKGYDAFDDQFRYEVKARRVTRDNGSRRLSAIRSLDQNQFDFLVGVLLGPEFDVVRAAVIPIGVVKAQSGFSKHTNAAIFYLRDSVWETNGVREITDELKQIEAGL